MKIVLRNDENGSAKITLFGPRAPSPPPPSLKRQREVVVRPQPVASGEPPVKRRRVSRKQRERELAGRKEALALLPTEIWDIILGEYLPPESGVPVYFVCKTWARIVHQRHSLDSLVRKQELGFLFLRGCILRQNLPLMAWAKHKGWRWRHGAQIYAAEHGCLESLEWLLKRQLGGRFSQDVMGAAIRGGHLPVVQWLCQMVREDRCYPAKRPLHLAIKHGRAGVARWLLETSRQNLLEGQNVRSELTSHLLLDAVRSGSPEVVDLVDQEMKKLPWTHLPPSGAELMALAVKAGHLEVVRYLRKTRHCPFNSHMFREAAAAGHLEVLRYMHQKLPSFITSSQSWLAIGTAAQYGHTHVVRFLHETVGQPLSQIMLDHACLTNNIELAAYCLQKGQIVPSYDAYRHAAIRQNLALIKLLYAHTPPDRVNWRAIMPVAEYNTPIAKWYCETYSKVLQQRAETLPDAP